MADDAHVVPARTAPASRRGHGAKPSDPAVIVATGRDAAGDGQSRPRGWGPSRSSIRAGRRFDDRVPPNPAGLG
jgi:hypothetical protein